MLQGIYIPDNFIDQYIEKRSMYIRIIMKDVITDK